MVALSVEAGQQAEGGEHRHVCRWARYRLGGWSRAARCEALATSCDPLRPLEEQQSPGRCSSVHLPEPAQEAVPGPGLDRYPDPRAAGSQ